MSWARTLTVVVAVVLIVPGLVLGGRTAGVGFGPRTDIGVEQVRFLESWIARGGAASMQQPFPEGSFFSLALTALAAARTGDPGQLELARGYRDRLESAEETDVFGRGMTPEHGIFAAGWTLLVGDQVFAASRTDADRQWVLSRAPAVRDALIASPTGVPASYPGQYWPSDAVVAAAALVTSARLLDQDGWRADLDRWRSTISTLDDPQLGLLPHRVDDDGRTLTGPRGASQSLIQALWPQITRFRDGRPELMSWQRFSDAFVVRAGGLVGTREYPIGQLGPGTSTRDRWCSGSASAPPWSS